MILILLDKKSIVCDAREGFASLLMKKHYYHEEILRLCDHQHRTVDRLFAALKEQHPKIGRSTVYRNVEELVKQKQLKKILGAGNMAYFEKKKEQHAHFICQQTGKIFDIDLPEIDLSTLPDGMKVEDLDVRIYGVCHG